MMQVSLRELFILVAFVAIGTASLRLAGPLASVFIALALLLCMAMAVAAAVDRGMRQAFATGFVLCTMAYAILLFATHSTELQLHAGRLPTSKLLSPLFEEIVNRTWVDRFSGRELPNYVPTRVDRLPGEMPTAAGVRVESETPDRMTFMIVGHILWASIFGYAGGKFAQFIYARRIADAERAK